MGKVESHAMAGKAPRRPGDAGPAETAAPTAGECSHGRRRRVQPAPAGKQRRCGAGQLQGFFAAAAPLLQLSKGGACACEPDSPCRAARVPRDVLVSIVPRPPGALWHGGSRPDRQRPGAGDTEIRSGPGALHGRGGSSQGGGTAGPKRQEYEIQILERLSDVGLN